MPYGNGSYNRQRLTPEQLDVRVTAQQRRQVRRQVRLRVHHMDGKHTAFCIKCDLCQLATGGKPINVGS